MSRELLYTRVGDGYVGQVVELDDQKVEAEDYGPIYARFCRKLKTRPDKANMVTLYERQRDGDIYWREGLARNGCVYTLYCMPGTEKKQIAALRAKLKRGRDVAAVYVVSIQKLLP